MKAFTLYLFVAFIAVSIQASLFFNLTRPDLVLVLVCFFSFKYGQKQGMLYGALTGLLIDSASGFIMGPNILSKAVTGYLMGATRRKFFQWNIFISTVLIGVFSFIDIYMIYICLETFAHMSFINRSFETSVLQVAYTMAAGLMLYPVLNSDIDNQTTLQVRSRIN